MRFAVPLAVMACTLAVASQAAALESHALVATRPVARAFPLAEAGKPAPWFVSGDDFAGVIRVAKHLQSDVGRVTGAKPELSTDEMPSSPHVVLVGTLGKSPLIDALLAKGKFDAAGLAGRWETFVLQAVENPMPGVEQALVIAGSDKRGTIFGMYELAAAIGVSPWNWWADVPAPRRTGLYVLPGRHSDGEPAVKYRGIFINDEAPALSGWVHERYGAFNHEFYDKVFELILRMKGNYLWPAMWGRSIYDDDPESPRLADEYGIVIGMSHHEPMMRSHVEWSRYGEGPWNYPANKERLQEFWREGIRRMGGNESVVTVGMRGDGDEPMTEGANIALLERIIADQREIIGDVTGRNPADVPQMWALYKEVQEYYDRGMRVPDDVMLMLCDDNWGNIRKLPPPGAPMRAGGYGVYYHFDYVGGPRNYKWLNTNPLPRVWEQMHLAYRHGANKLWIVNVGDIKPMELPTEFFLEYAWNPEAWPAERIPEYMRTWSAKNFGDEFASPIAEILAKYAKYNGRRKPELLSPDTYSLTNYREADRIVNEYNQLAAEAEEIGAALPAEWQDAYFQLVLFPVQACANLNEMYVAAAKNKLFAQQRRAATSVMAKEVRRLFDRDAELTRQYHEDVADGKWRHMMDQTHIGYTYWQEPPRNRMPRVTILDLPQRAELGVAVEGSDDCWPDASVEPPMLKFHPWSRAQRRYVDIFNRGLAPFDVVIESDEPWVQIFNQPRRIETEQRFEIGVDWETAPRGHGIASVTITGPDKTQVSLQIVTDRPAGDASPPPRGFLEADGYVAMEAEHYAALVDAPPIRWQRIPDLGRTLSGMTPLPVTAPRQKLSRESPRLEYRMQLAAPGELRVHAYISPTLDYANADGRRYAISIDDGEPQIVNINEDASPRTWERHVADNVNVTHTVHSVETAGEHVLKYWMVDPGVVLQRLVVDRGETTASYLGPPESQLGEALAD